MNNNIIQNKGEILELLNKLRTNSILKIATALETPQGIRYRIYVDKVQNYMNSNGVALAQINDALKTVFFSDAGHVAPEKVRQAKLLLNAILGRSSEMEINDEEQGGISGAVQVLDIR